MPPASKSLPCPPLPFALAISLVPAFIVLELLKKSPLPKLIVVEIPRRLCSSAHIFAIVGFVFPRSPSCFRYHPRKILGLPPPPSSKKLAAATDPDLVASESSRISVHVMPHSRASSSDPLSPCHLTITKMPRRRSSSLSPAIFFTWSLQSSSICHEPRIVSLLPLPTPYASPFSPGTFVPQ